MNLPRPALLLLVGALAGCTTQQATTVQSATKMVGALCPDITLIDPTAPSLPALCTTAAEIAAFVETFIPTTAGAAPGVKAAPTAHETYVGIAALHAKAVAK
jgi:hypothetical protein